MVETEEMTRIKIMKKAISDTGVCPECEVKAKEDGSYPWDDCIADQIKKGASEEDAKKICGKIKANAGK